MRTFKQYLAEGMWDDPDEDEDYGLTGLAALAHDALVGLLRSATRTPMQAFARESQAHTTAVLPKNARIAWDVGAKEVALKTQVMRTQATKTTARVRIYVLADNVAVVHVYFRFSMIPTDPTRENYSLSVHVTPYLQLAHKHNDEHRRSVIALARQIVKALQAKLPSWWVKEHKAIFRVKR